MKLGKLEETIARDKRGIFTILAIASTIGILINSIIFLSSIIGIILAIIYFSVNSIFLGNVFFKEENASFRLLLGLLVLLMIIAMEGAFLIIMSAVFPIRFDAKATVAILNLATVAIWFMRRIRFAKILKLNAS